MKTLLLSSSGKFVMDNESKLFSKPLSKMKLAYIITASKDVSDKVYLERHKKKMEKLGFDFEEVDIAGKNEKELRNLLKDKEAIHVEGGNTYYLLKCARESGFKKVIEDLTEKGVVYIGTSAGSYLMTPGIQMSSWKKEEKRHGVTDFRGLSFVPFLLFAHYRPMHKEMLKEKIRKLKYPLRILKDGQAILVRGNKVEFLGGKEVKIK